MSRTVRTCLISALLATLGLGLLTACDDGSVYVDTNQDAAGPGLELGWSVVDPARVDLPTSDPITPGAAVPEDGEPVLVNLWASWCAPCKKELPLLQEVDASGALRVVGFTRDRREDEATAALDRAGVTYPNWTDKDMAVPVSLDGRIPINSVPSSFLMLDGRVVAVHIGEFTDRSEVLAGLTLKGLNP